MNRIYYVNEFIFITCYSNVYTPLYAALTTGMRINFSTWSCISETRGQYTITFQSDLV
jgi:hypothetical protein